MIVHLFGSLFVQLMSLLHQLWYNQMISIDDEYLDEINYIMYSAHQNGEVSESELGDDEADEFLENKNQAMEMEEEVMDPHVSVGGTLGSAALGIIKGMIGPAILYLPHAFAAAGWAVAIPLLILSLTMFLWSSQCLLESWRIEHKRISRRSSSRRKKRVHLSYPELAYRSYGLRGERIVQIGIFMMQSGVCITYLIFVPQNLCASALLLFGWDISTNWCLVFMMTVQIPLSWIRDIRKFKTTNLLGNVLIFYGWIACLGFAMDAMIRFDSGSSRAVAVGPEESFADGVAQRLGELAPFNPSGWFLFIGTSVFMFEG
jgi:proton-coupled amino acid transporter